MKVVILLLAFLPLTANAQRSMSEYTAAQRAAVQAYVAENPSYAFMPETQFPQEALQYLRSSEGRAEFGIRANWKPYYQVGDFNRDNLRDFAVILLNGTSISDENSRLRFVVFNQVSGSVYSVGYDLMVPAFNQIYTNVADDGRPCWSAVEAGACYTYVEEIGGYDPCGGM